MKFETIKKIVKKVLVETWGATEKQADEAIINVAETELGAFEKKFTEEIGIPNWEESLSIEGWTLGDHEFSIDIQQDRGYFFVFFHFGSCCLDVEKANEAMAEYAESELYDLLPIENAVDGEEDCLMLSRHFPANSEQELYDALNSIFEAFCDEKNADLLYNMVQYFE